MNTSKTRRVIDLAANDQELQPYAQLMQEPPISTREQAAVRKSVTR